MFRRYLFPIIACAALIVLSGVLVSAQTGELRGHVTLKQADGTVVPAADVVIDVYRMDLTGKFNTKTGKKGGFVFAGLPYTGDYVIVASMPGAQAYWQSGVKAGRDVDYAIDLMPGDGKRLTLDELKTIMAAQGSGSRAASGATKETGEDKAKRAELEKKNTEITAKNEKILKSNEIVTRTYKAGNDALLAKNYDEAIKQYEEGLAAYPEEPVLLVNEARAYTAPG
ncbi:MAG TPA: hypothetical protein DCK93_16255, partial [Blastocatellia bacterium]|nr:hypothetical protein [Blastocatellia bacterium]